VPAEPDADRRLEALERDTAKRLDDARDIHRREHESAEIAHREVHELQSKVGEGVVTAYEVRFRLEEKARDTATAAMEKRLEGMNEFRNQLRDQQATFVRREVFDALMERVTNIEKGDVKQAGQRIGQGTVIATIVGAITFVGVVLGIVIVLANFATGTPP
jgi:hypothetical protein